MPFAKRRQARQATRPSSRIRTRL
jgi:hypothetical protein